jgi:hypothetical protein
MEGKEFFESFFFCFRCEDDELINGQQVWEDPRAKIWNR